MTSHDLQNVATSSSRLDQVQTVSYWINSKKFHGRSCQAIVCESTFRCKQDRRCTYNVTMRRVRITIVAVEKAMSIILLYKSQQDAQFTEFILSDNCSTCFWRHYHPSSGTQNNCKINSVICASCWDLYTRILLRCTDP